MAQALWEVKHNRSREEIDAFVSKLRIYTISDQDNTAPWIHRMFPNLFYIVSPGYEENGGGHIIILLGWASQEISFMVVLMAPIFRWSTTLGRTSIYVKIMVH